MRSWAASLALAASVSAVGVAHAESAECDVPVIHASRNGDDGKAPVIDPTINRLKPYFERAPFTAWGEFKLLDRKELTIPVNGSSSFALPNGREATLSFVEHSTGPGDHRMRLRLAIDDKNKKGKMLDTTFVLDEGGVVLQVGQKYQGGVLVIGVSCKTHD
ncbi:MAG TPA: hypothetical protein VHB97_09040 [Polyangia bacterium]|jgi:hypothetical protein|nr:hypothetical protein [Polyangia bacterium]